ncbi:MAG TPA: ATP-dependent sacrificial sulfur transferase LarE [Acidimicrobiales bacterium]|nr:ATP-dependent sacrificial sulfur transferase LarE [Acidimicrobiales bacterium]
MTVTGSPARRVAGADHPAAPAPGASLDDLRERLRTLSPVIVAFSGGADSAFLAWVAHDSLGAGAAQIITAVSPSLAPEEEADCAALAEEWGLRWTAIATGELANPDYAANDGSRCYWCKDELMAAIGPVAEVCGATVVLGVNLDDLGDHRPGQQAAIEAGAVFPLLDAGFTKADVRSWSRRLGLRTWDKPAAACLASRVPYGTPVSLGVLESVARAESALRALGYRQLRVRHYGELARLEFDDPELDRAFEQRDEIVAAVQAAGYRYVTLDLEGFCSGNLNGMLSPRAGPCG